MASNLDLLDKEALAKLLPDAKQEVSRREAERQSRNKLYTMFPDTGEFRRELYKKHLTFFKAGAVYKERLFMAANRCAVPWSTVETDHATRQFVELIGAGDFSVRSWDGGSRCTRPASPVFLRGIEPAFLLLLGDGKTFGCSGRHRVLTVEGWVEVGQLIRRASGLRCRRIASSSSANCGTDGRRDDAQLLASKGTDQGRTPSREHARQRIPVGALADEAEPTRGRSRASLWLDHPSMTDDPSRIAALCAQFGDPSERISAIWSTRIRQELRQFAVESALSLQDRGFGHRSLPEYGAPLENGSGGVGRTHSASLLSRSTAQLSGFASALVASGEGFLEAEPLAEIFFPFDLPAFIGNSKIESIIPLGIQPILDFSVQKTHCYESEGLIHHNCGKSTAGGVEMAYHLTGLYPDWWEGRTFDKSIEAWACGTNSETTRDIVQDILLGPSDKIGTGMIPADLIERVVPRRGGIAGSMETVRVKHKTGAISTCSFKSYEQGRESFEGTARQIIWLDEESPEDVYTECLFRTATVRGIVYTTFTPLQGISAVVKGFLEPENPQESAKYKFYVQAGWKDVPHIPEEEKQALLATTPPYQIAARTEGEPALGSGAVYPIAISEITANLLIIPESWPRAFGMDVGWQRTAAVWGAKDPATGVIYIYSEHYQGMGEPASHAFSIKERGEWIPGVIDPASNGRSQVDGKTLIDLYRKLGLRIQPADNSVEAGISEVWQLMVSGKLKILITCENLLRELKRYHRDNKGSGKIVKSDDHACDALRYLIMSGRKRMMGPPRPHVRYQSEPPSGDRGWMS